MSGAAPKVQAQKPPAGKTGAGTYLLTFSSHAQVGGKKLPRWVRVTASADGKILKISTSR
jgi:hypothetical protein